MAEGFVFRLEKKRNKSNLEFFIKFCVKISRGLQRTCKHQKHLCTVCVSSDVVIAVFNVWSLDQDLDVLRADAALVSDLHIA